TLRRFWASSRAGKFTRLSEIAKGGAAPGSSKASQAPTPLRGECLTLNTSEWPNDAAVCSLSDILETGDVPRRFFLSATACRGILRRAEKRGKDLPAALSSALQAVA